jgi:queuine/archaeosine tRNA-ribosyltransferase
MIEILSEDTNTQARRGIMTLPHGVVENTHFYASGNKWNSKGNSL